MKLIVVPFSHMQQKLNFKVLMRSQNLNEAQKEKKNIVEVLEMSQK
jgi:hypothetical protein